MNVFFNDLLADLVEPLAIGAKDSAETISTEESVRKIDDLNEKLMNEKTNESNRDEKPANNRCRCSESKRLKIRKNMKTLIMEKKRIRNCHHQCRTER